MDINLANRNAIVCGSTQGIGRASAIALAKLGANVTLLARNRGRLEAVAAQLDASRDQKHGFLVADFSEPEGLESALNGHFKGFGKVCHILVNNTGGPASGSIEEATPNDFLSAFRSHLICNQLLALAVLPGMRSAGYGRIINIISTSVKVPIDGLGVSNTIRAAVANWAKTLANETGVHGITVNNVLPGFTNTDRLTDLIRKRAENSGESTEKVTAEMLNSVPMKRFAKPEEVAAAVAFLASPAASYINGINVPVDGGRTGCL